MNDTQDLIEANKANQPKVLDFDEPDNGFIAGHDLRTEYEIKSKFIFEELEMGDCWHEFDRSAENEKFLAQLKCKVCLKLKYVDFVNPNFFTNDADCRKALIILAEKGLLYMTTQKLLEIANLNFNMDLLLTTPGQRAEAIFQTLKNKEKKDD